MSNRSTMHKKSLQTAFCGIFCGLSIAVMLTGGIIPIATYCAPLAAGLLLIPVTVEYGSASAWMVWLATALLSLILGIDKEAACFYLFFGYYPLLKPLIEKKFGKTLRTVIKLIFFVVSGAVMYSLLCLIFPIEAINAEFAEMGAWITAGFFAVMLLCLMLYDRILRSVVILYLKKLRPRLSFLRRG